MIKKENVLNRTDGGLKILLDYYPQAEQVVGTKNKFRMRRDERTPSATIRQKQDGTWVVTDFGDDGHEMNAIDVAMKEDRLSFREAVLRLAARYGVSDELKREVNRPRVEERAAKPDEKEGAEFYELNEEMTDEELRLLGPLVTQEHVDTLHWHSVKWWARVKDRRVKVKYSTPTFPIFLRECVVKEGNEGAQTERFFKIYEPLNYDKGFRFKYYPAGAKPRRYVNGLYELRQAYRKYNAEEEAAFKNDPRNEDKPYKEKKLPEAFICSGERDALCVRSLGYWPLWFNSETYNVDEREMKEIMKYVEVLYNIPDIDETGIRRGTQLALQYIDIHTIWLPQKYMAGFTDMRGKGYKDFRDWMEAKDNQGPKAFRQLLNMAMPAKFWWSKLNTRTNQWDHQIDTACLHEFLRLNGFQTLHDDDVAAPQYIHINGNTVRRINAKDIREFIISWASSHYLPRDIRNLILNSPKIQGQALESLEEVTLDFSNSTACSQLFFFENTTVKVTAAGIEDGAAGHYVWEKDVQPHRLTLMDDMFRIAREKDAEGRDVWDIEVFSPSGKPVGTVASKFLGYVINSSRIYWRKELEENLAGMDPSAAEAYRQAHHFDIAGEGLTAEEVRIQKQNLISKIFAIGYLLHRYKEASKTWAPYCMDNKVGQDGECNGRSGKSFLIKSISTLMKTVKLSGRNPRLMDNPHVFDQVTRHTDLLLVDDCSQYFDTGLLYDVITGDMTVNPKNNQSYTIPYAESPKIAFTTNYVPMNFAPSTEARLLFVVFSDYYHEKSQENDYLESRSIYNDFGKELYGRDYSEAEWNADYNFMMQCCRFYLSLAPENLKLQPPMGDIMLRKYRADMGSNFEDWAEVYFSPESGNLDRFIPRSEVFECFRLQTGLHKWTPNRFKRALQGFAQFHRDRLELDPEELRNSSGRIIRKGADGRTTEMYFMRTRSGQFGDAGSETPTQQSLPFSAPEDGEIDWDAMQSDK